MFHVEHFCNIKNQDMFHVEQLREFVYNVTFHMDFVPRGTKSGNS